MAAPMKNIITSLTRSFNKSLRSVNIAIDILFKNGPPPSLAIASSNAVACPSGSNNDIKTMEDLNSIYGGVLHAVQRARRTVERRLKRKHAFTGHFEHAMPKRNIIPCLDCGNFREKGHLCEYCYNKVRQETKQMQEKMGEDLKDRAPTKEVVYLYEGETVNDHGKLVVDMEKPRPGWFPRKLLNKTG